MLMLMCVTYTVTMPLYRRSGVAGGCMVVIRADGVIKVNGSEGTVPVWASRAGRPHSTCSFLNMATMKGTGGKNFILLHSSSCTLFTVLSVICICFQSSPAVPAAHPAQAAVFNRPRTRGSVSTHRPYTAGQRQRNNDPAA